MNCAECSSHTTTVTADKELLVKATAGCAHSAPEWVCLGCTPADQQFLSRFCATCKVRVCAIAKGVQNCAACAEHDTCAEIKAVIARESKELGLRMTWLRERFEALAG
jgi:hypothetical protein